MAMGDLTGIGFDSFCGSGDGGEVTLTSFLDSEYICDNNTNTWFRIVNSIDATTGAVTQISSTDTGVSCDDPAPGVATRTLSTLSECRTDTIWIVSYQVDPDGTLTELNAFDTGESCSVPTPVLATTQCYEDAAGDSFCVKVYSDGEQIATDALGNIVDITAGIPADWTLVDCNACGAAGGDDVLSTGRGSRTLDAGTYVLDAENTYLESACVTGIAGTATITDSFGNQSLLRQGQTKCWEAADNDPLATMSITVPAGGQIDFWWTEPII